MAAADDGGERVALHRDDPGAREAAPRGDGEAARARARVNDARRVGPPSRPLDHRVTIGAGVYVAPSGRRRSGPRRRQKASPSGSSPSATAARSAATPPGGGSAARASAVSASDHPGTSRAPSARAAPARRRLGGDPVAGPAGHPSERRNDARTAPRGRARVHTPGDEVAADVGERWRRGPAGEVLGRRHPRGAGSAAASAAPASRASSSRCCSRSWAAAGASTRGPGCDQLDPTPAATGDQVAQGPDPDANLVAFVRFVVEDIQDSWTVVFTDLGEEYQPTTLRIFAAESRPGAAAASSATGPFYCPVNRFVYLDLGFFRELRDRFGAPGDFAQAYVIAHEVRPPRPEPPRDPPGGEPAQQREPRRGERAVGELELQADCFAGVWAHSAYAQNQLEEGDLEEGLKAASVRRRRPHPAGRDGRIDPESFTHGSAEQRRNWFLTGFQEGDPAACNTFTASRL